MQVHDNIYIIILTPTNQSIEVLNTASRVVLSVLDKVLFEPETDRNSNSIQPQASNLLDIILCGPRIPMLLKSLVSCILAQMLNTLPLVVQATTAHGVELILGHPWLDDELGAEVDATDLDVSWDPGARLFVVSNYDV